MFRTTKKNRIINVELMRIVACLLVLGCHSLSGSYNAEGFVSAFKVCLQCCFADGVAVFWLILGFFAFTSFNYSRRLRTCFVKVCLPALLWFLVIYFFEDFILLKSTLSDFAAHSFEDIKHVIVNAIGLNLSSYQSFSHYGYIESYIQVIIFLPLLYLLHIRLSKNLKLEVFFIIFLFVFLIVNDIKLGKLVSILPSFITGIFLPCCYVLYGSIIYKYRNKFLSRKWLFLAPILFVIVNSIRTVIEVSLIQTCSSGDNTYYLFGNTTFGLSNATLIFLFCISIKFQCCKNGAIAYLGSATFAIYVVQNLVANILYCYGIKEAILCGLQTLGLPNSLVYVLNLIVVVALLFLIGLGFYVFGNMVKKITKTLFIRVNVGLAETVFKKLK